MNTEKSMLDKLVDSVKTMDGWKAFADSNDGKGDFDYYCKPGDYVSEDIFDYFLNVLPPHRWSKDYLQAGEPDDYKLNLKTGIYQDTWTTFVRGPKIKGKQLWEFRGNCFTNETQSPDVYIKYENIREFLKATYHLNPMTDMQTSRPRIICNDGFNFSVQAGDGMYCQPRENLESGEYECVECGFPSEREELLMRYAEDVSKPKKSVYSFVPVEVVDEVIKKHGGFFDARMPIVG